MKKSVLRLVLVLLGTATVTTRAQEYLYDEIEPPAQVAEMPTPFAPLAEVAPTGKLGSFVREPFVRDITFDLRPRFFYRSVINDRGAQDTFAGGGALAVTTGWWKDFLQLGATGYLSMPLVSERGDNRSGLVKENGEGIAVLGEAWAKLKFGPVTAKLYRQALNLPFMNMNDSRMIPNTFEAYQLGGKFWDLLRVDAGYVAQIKTRTSDIFVPMSEAAGAPDVDRGTTFLDFILGAEDKTYLGAINETTWDLFTTTYAQAGHTWEVTEDFQLRGDLQFADQRSVGASYIGDFETQFYGGRLAGSYGNAVLSFAYTKTADGAGVFDPYGVDPGFNGMMISGFAQRGEQSAGPSLSYDFAKIGLPGLTTFGSYIYGWMPEAGWEQELNATVDYRIDKGWMKNLWLRLRYAYNESSSSGNFNDFRVILNYSITF